MSSLGLTAPAAADSEAVEAALGDHFAFESYSGGGVRPEQIPPDLWERFVVIDTRDAGQYEEDHIPGAKHIEWRQVLNERDRIPEDEPVLLYCNTSSFSAQAALALRMTGYDNVKILAGGFDAWKAKGGFEAYKESD
ncbi:MAG: rhodanese-like domain-containing protein [Thiohalospira sp.]